MDIRLWSNLPHDKQYTIHIYNTTHVDEAILTGRKGVTVEVTAQGNITL